MPPSETPFPFAMSQTVAKGISQSAFTLGTVQLGMPYGAANKTGQPDRAMAVQIVQEAIKAGITHLDCAQSYGTAEEVLGSALKMFNHQPVIITKLDPAIDLFDSSLPDTIANQVVTLVERSVKRLGRDALDVMLLHRWYHRTSHQGIIWKTLLALRDQGCIKQLGVSVQNTSEAFEAIQDSDITYLQLPCNLLDWRWEEAGIDKMIQQREDMIVHARSTLLQGVLAAEANCWPQIDNPPNGYPDNLIQPIHQLTDVLNRQNLPDLCIAYVRSLPWIDSLVVGVETMEQLRQNIALFQQPSLSFEEVFKVRDALPKVPEQLLDPSQWHRT